MRRRRWYAAVTELILPPGKRQGREGMRERVPAGPAPAAMDPAGL